MKKEPERRRASIVEFFVNGVRVYSRGLWREDKSGTIERHPGGSVVMYGGERRKPAGSPRGRRRRPKR